MTETPIPQASPASEPQKAKRSLLPLVALILVCLLAGSFIGYAVTYSALDGRINQLQSQLQYSQSESTGTSGSTYILSDNTSLTGLYQNIKGSVVVIQDLVAEYFMGRLYSYSMQQGSGFITTVNGEQVVVTNNHVVEGSTNITVTFANGNTYAADILGSDPQADLAVLSVDSMPSGVKSLTLVSSSTLSVGDPVVAVGSPYGLSGTLTSGIISALGRTITVSDDSSSSSSTTIPDVIQTSTPINSGNSGGPLINYNGQVIGITTAAVSNSEGLGFAIPSDTIIREIVSLVNSGSYNNHPSLNAVGVDMNYQIAQEMGTSVTYGWLVESASENSGLQGGSARATILGSTVIIGGDIIIGIEGKTITNTDDLLSYLEKYTVPRQSIDVMVVRDGSTQTVSVQVGSL
jgi:S1-C subfamily serine protease